MAATDGPMAPLPSSYGGVAPLVVTRCSVVHTAGGDVPLKEHVCTVCGKAFRSIKDCKRHTIIHSGSKPFRCPFCSHTANLSFNLKKHILKLHPEQFPSYAANNNSSTSASAHNSYHLV